MVTLKKISVEQCRECLEKDNYMLTTRHKLFGVSINFRHKILSLYHRGNTNIRHPHI